MGLRSALRRDNQQHAQQGELVFLIRRVSEASSSSAALSRAPPPARAR